MNIRAVLIIVIVSSTSKATRRWSMGQVILRNAAGGKDTRDLEGW